MQLLNVAAARSTWLLDMNDLNPKGKSIFPELIEWLKNQYSFDEVPSSSTDVDKDTNGLMFKRGSFQVRDEVFVSVDLSIYTDGLAANTYSSTHDTDAFLEDLLTLSTKDFSLAYDPTMIRKKLPLSEVNVRLDQSMSRLNPGLAGFARKISERSPQRSEFELGGVSFWTDTSESALKLAAFSIERKIGAPFSENRFYSKASLQTDNHLRLLGEFEELLKNAVPTVH